MVEINTDIYSVCEELNLFRLTEFAKPMPRNLIVPIAMFLDGVDCLPLRQFEVV